MSDGATIQATKKRERSKSYPCVTLEKAVSMVREIELKLGRTPYAGLDVSRALGHESLTGLGAQKVAALGYYDLLNRDGKIYSLSNLSRDILHPMSAEEKKRALVQAAKSPRLFGKLILQYQGQSLPTMLQSVLIREGVSTKSAKEASDIFTKTLNFTGLLINGVIITPSTNKGRGVESNLDSKDQFNNIDSANLSDSSSGSQKPSQAYYDSGNGWNLTIKSDKLIPSNVKKILIDVADLLNREADKA